MARDGRTVVFVEVKAREGQAFGDGAEAVTAFKRQRIGRVALDYLARHRLTEYPCRFDVVVVGLGTGEAAIDVYQNAFDLSC